MNISTVKKKLSKIDWDFETENTKYLTHTVHRYSSKYIPQIPKELMKITSNPGDLIIDPFMGSGTTLIEAALNQRKSMGFDINPIALMISKVKTTPIEKRMLDDKVSAHYKIIKETIVQRNLSKAQQTLTETPHIKDTRLDDKWFIKWFKPYVLDELILIDSFISKEDDSRVRLLMEVSISNVLRRVSNAHPGYPNVMFNRALPERPYPGELYLNQLTKFSKMVSELDGKIDKEYVPKCELGDARNLPLDDNIIDGIITHPPYIGSVPYAEYLSINLKWFGHEPKTLDSKLIGGKRQTRDVVERFNEGLTKSIEECYRVLKSNAFYSVVIGNPVVRREIVMLNEFIIRESTRIGFNLVKEIERKKFNTRANKMPNEYILVFSKP